MNESIGNGLLEVPISDEVRDELDRRLAAYYADPSSARPWNEIKEELFGTREQVGAIDQMQK